MTVNPYQPPVDPQDAPLRSNPLQGPAIGCAVFGGISLLASLAYFGLSATLFSLAREAERALEPAHETLGAGVTFLALSILFFLMTWSMFKRRNRWLVTLGAIVGTALVLPAPVTVIILMRMSQTEIWRSFDHPRSSA